MVTFQDETFVIDLGHNCHLSKFSPRNYYETIDSVDCKRLFLDNCHLRNADSIFTKEIKEIITFGYWFASKNINRSLLGTAQMITLFMITIRGFHRWTMLQIHLDRSISLEGSLVFEQYANISMRDTPFWGLLHFYNKFFWKFPFRGCMVSPSPLSPLYGFERQVWSEKFQNFVQKC